MSSPAVPATPTKAAINLASPSTPETTLSPTSKALKITSTNRSPGAWTRPMMMVGAVAAAGAVGLGLFGGFTVPELNSQVRELEEQVDRLNGEVNRLEVENDRFELNNANLNMSIIYLNDLNGQLNETSKRLAASVIQLNETKEDLIEINEGLKVERERFAANNQVINETNIFLNTQVEELEGAVDRLIFNNQALTDVKNGLEKTADDLNSTNDNLMESILSLNQSIAALNADRSKLRELNDELANVTEFLEGSARESGQAVEDFNGNIAAQIELSRSLGTRSNSLSYIDLSDFWDCSFIDLFLSEVWVQDTSLAIPLDSWSAVFDGVFDQLLQPICLDRTDFENYFFQEFSTPVTMNKIFAAADEYTAGALEFYFNGGVTDAEWQAAGFDCTGLPQYRAVEA